MESSHALAERQAPPGKPARGNRHLWVPTEVGAPGILLAHALDRAEGHPDNCSDTGRQLDVHRDTVRAHRDELVRRGFVAVVDGYIVGTPAGRELLRRSSPLPRVLLRGRGRKPSLPVLLGCAVVYADAVGWVPTERVVNGRRFVGPYVRTDEQRADMAGIAESTVRSARRLLIDLGLVGVETVQRRRAALVRAIRIAGSKATHGRPMSETRADRLADLARRGRARLRRGAEQTSLVGAEQPAPPMQSPVETIPMQAPPAPVADGAEIASLPNGWQNAEPRRRGSTKTPAEILAHVLPNMPAVVEQRQAAAATAHETATVELRRLAGDPADVARLLRMTADRGCAALLTLLRVDDLAPPRRAGRAVQVARTLGTAGLLRQAADAALGKPRSLAGVVVNRLGLIAKGQDPTTYCRRGWSLRSFLDALAGHGVTANGHVVRAKDHDPHKAVALLATAEAAQRGDWRSVDVRMTRHGLDAVAVADAACVDLRELQHHLAELAEQRAAAFAEARALA